MKRNQRHEKSARILAIAAVILTSVLLFSCKMEQKQTARPSAVVHPEWSRNAVIYEVNIRQYTIEGTFRAFEQHIPRLKDMGVDILWLMPINPIGEKNRKGSLGSYYSIRDYMAVNPEYGTMEDFKELVAKAHENGMKVIIDWVANHSSWDNILVTEHPEWYVKDSTGTIVAPVPDWTDVADLDYNQQGLRDYMTNAMLFWVKEADVDGFRCDVAGMVPTDFWNKAVPELKKVKHVFMLAEWETPEMHDTAFDMTYSWEVYKLLKAVCKGEKTMDQLDSLLVKEAGEFTPDAYRMNFTTNHDENSWNGTEYELFGDAAQTFTVLDYLLPGMPLIYSGQEAGLNKRLSFFDKDTIQWNAYKLAGFYTQLNKLKHANNALQNGSAGGPLVRLKTGDNAKIYGFSREAEGNKVVALFNLSGEPANAVLAGNELSGDYEDVFNPGIIRFEETSVIPLKPWEYRVWIKK
jgi:cyclomaltodextrinase / maltogenic alpha-amylase / neopullulanase